MDATERMLVGATMLPQVAAVTLMTGYATPPNSSPEVLRLSPHLIRAALPRSQMTTEQDLVAGMALEGLAPRR